VVCFTPSFQMKEALGLTCSDRLVQDDTIAYYYG
jgi:hypothetical protein